MESEESLDIVHGISGKTGHCPRNQWKVWTLSMESVISLGIVHGISGKSGHCPWNQW